jgi:hypothetical protein
MMTTAIPTKDAENADAADDGHQIVDGEEPGQEGGGDGKQQHRQGENDPLLAHAPRHSAGTHDRRSQPASFLWANSIEWILSAQMKRL